MKKLTFSFDIGHSSIGWAILAGGNANDPEVCGTGVVTFPVDDCLASTRRDLRRTRRHIRSTRDRIERLKKYLLRIRFLSREDLDRPGHPAPFLLAAATHQKNYQPSALELWHIIRWYAHNRGYDGNSRWASQEAEGEDDTAKVVEAKKWMAEKGTRTMAHTICKLLNLDPSKPKQKISSHLPYKTLNTAYPRNIVTAEVKQILAHSSLPPEAQALILTDDPLNSEQRAILIDADIKLPKRYHGGLLFGQLVPRFDNRIISRCPITWATIYQREIDAGNSEEEATRIAERDSKVPAKKSVEFLQYRFARILANIKLEGKPLPKDLRQSLFNLAGQRGHLSARELSAHIDEHTPGGETNVESFFKLHPDSEEALTLDPVANEVRKATESKASTLYPFWPLITEEGRNVIKEEWAKGRKVSLAFICNLEPDNSELLGALENAFSGLKASDRKKMGDFETFLTRKKAGPDGLNGRASFARPVLKQVKDEILAGWDATKPAKSTDHPDGEAKPVDGVLYQYSLPNSKVNELLTKRPLDKLTNNHLVRHRLLILERLVTELIAEFAQNDPKKVTDVVVEVARELKEMSGKTAKQIKAALGSRLSDFKKAIAHLEKHAPYLPLNGGIIRKCRIAMDMDWTCPFTGQRYDATDLPFLDREHIIPFSSRQTNALHALVLTRPEVNRWKGKSTARQFILDHGGERVPNMENLTIQSVRSYDEFVKKLKVSGHDDDCRRQKARKALLMTTEFNEREQGFTEGALTQSSHLIKLALRGLKRQIPSAQHHVVPGIATSEVRKAWSLLELLGHPTICGRQVLRWIEDYDPRQRTFTTNEGNQYSLFEKAALIEKRGKRELPKNAFPCPNDQCEAPLTWPEDDPSHLACPDCQRVLRKVSKPKEEIRSLTHLHHALDALTIGLIAHYFPLTQRGENISGKLWKALLSRNKSKEELEILSSTGLFNFTEKINEKGDLQNRAFLRDLNSQVKSKLIARLAESRVSQHIPADRSGSRAELTTWGVTRVEETKEGKRIHIHQNATEVKEGKRKRTPKKRSEDASKLLGPEPPAGKGKLKDINGALIISENYGLALDPVPRVIRFHKVHQTLEELRIANHGNFIRILRPGMLIRVNNWPGKNGVWRINGTQASLLIDLAMPWEIGRSWQNVAISSLISRGLEILPNRYSGLSLPKSSEG